MTIRELIDELEELADEHGDDIDVRLAQQPQWAFEYSIGTVAAVSDDDDVENEDEDDDTSDADAETVVYIGEGRQLGYLSGVASRVLGWGRDR